MDAKSAVAVRIIKLCCERGIATNALATMSGITPSTVYTLLDDRYKDVKITTLKKICDGLNITLREFFDSDLFDNLEQEIK